jgi:hypothetical protein
MTKIVNPALIYFAGMVGSLKTWLTIIALFALCISLASFVYYMFETYDDENYTVTGPDERKERKAWSKNAKRFLTIGIILAVVNIAIPNKKTLYMMMVFDALTVENITSAGETAKDVVDYVVEQIDTIVNDKSE